MRVLLIDNYDSFTYNLVHLVEPVVDELVVWRNDRFNLEEVASFDKIIFSPGPSLPEEAGLMMTVIDHYHQQIPMLGVCLGFQALVEYFNGELTNLDPVRHGESTNINVLNKECLFRGLEDLEEVGLYHSWGVLDDFLPKSLLKLATDKNGIIMAIKHQKYPLFGVQFHPESIMTPNGKKMIENWINIK